ncbi:uncharacterized protein LOC129797791 [Lutzomyia longipalpis]|uniref:uncharacterized protein LOC129797791 n=1 Tax=Lutzomyia longipalpis TaxID=7200 RepID=UPI002483F4ED|nr:uncharacterized protein LOC129797791 [Lutzomyia longipalpis]
MGSGLVEEKIISSERFGNPLFRAGFDGHILRNDLIKPITYENHYPHFYDGTYEHLPLDHYALRFPHELRHFPTEYRYTPEAITTDFRYNLPYGYAHRNYLLH